MGTGEGSVEARNNCPVTNFNLPYPGVSWVGRQVCGNNTCGSFETAGKGAPQSQVQGHARDKQGGAGVHAQGVGATAPRFLRGLGRKQRPRRSFLLLVLSIVPTLGKGLPSGSVWPSPGVGGRPVPSCAEKARAAGRPGCVLLEDTRPSPAPRLPPASHSLEGREPLTVTLPCLS